MSSALWINGGWERPVAAGNSYDYYVGTSWSYKGLFSASTDANVKMFEAGTISYLGVNVPENNLTIAGTRVNITLFVNGIATALTKSIAMGDVGHFLDSINSVNVVAGDEVFIRVAHTNVFDFSINLGAVFVVFTPTDISRTVTQVVCNNIIGATAGINFGQTRYIALSGIIETGSTTQADRQDCVPIDCECENIRIQIGQNSYDQDTILTLQVNGIDTALTITIGAGVTGWLEATGSIAIAAHDLVGYKYDTTASSSGVGVIATITSQFVSSIGEWFQGLGQLIRTPSGDSPLGVGGDNAAVYTEDAQQVSIPIEGRVKGLCINVRTNSGSGDSHLYLRKNGINGVTDVLISSGATGFIDAAGPDPLAVNDLVSLWLDIPVAGAITYSTINWIGTFESEPIPPPAGTLGIYEMIPNKTNDTLWTGPGTTEDVKIP